VEDFDDGSELLGLPQGTAVEVLQTGLGSEGNLVKVRVTRDEQKLTTVFVQQADVAVG